MSDINIVFTRVDNRLVHGQVGNVWVTASGANLILVVDDETCNDELSKSLMKMTADAVGVQIRFFSIKKTIEMYRPPKVRPKNLTIGGRHFYGKIQL